jgi:hypothetical protein
MKARWEKIAMPQFGLTAPGGSGTAQDQWAAVDEDDEVMAVVAEGMGGLWSASVTYTGVGGNSKSGTFLSEAAAKRRVEKWFSPQYTFDKQNASWVYQVSP